MDFFNFDYDNYKMDFNYLNQEVDISNETLYEYVSDIIRDDLVDESYDILLRAKHHQKAMKYYNQFVNAYHMVQQGKDSMGNICCMCIDFAICKIRDISYEEY